VPAVYHQQGVPQAGCVCWSVSNWALCVLWASITCCACRSACGIVQVLAASAAYLHCSYLLARSLSRQMFCVWLSPGLLAEWALQVPPQALLMGSAGAHIDCLALDRYCAWVHVYCVQVWPISRPCWRSSLVTPSAYVECGCYAACFTTWRHQFLRTTHTLTCMQVQLPRVRSRKRRCEKPAHSVRRGNLH
jgi:hypothetical protein